MRQRVTMGPSNRENHGKNIFNIIWIKATLKLVVFIVTTVRQCGGAGSRGIFSSFIYLQYSTTDSCCGGLSITEYGQKILFRRNSILYFILYTVSHLSLWRLRSNSANLLRTAKGMGWVVMNDHVEFLARSNFGYLHIIHIVHIVWTWSENGVASLSPSRASLPVFAPSQLIVLTLAVLTLLMLLRRTFS